MSLSDQWLVLDWYDGVISALDRTKQPIEFYLLVAIDDSINEKIYLNTTLTDTESTIFLQREHENPSRHSYYKLTTDVENIFRIKNNVKVIKCLDLRSDQQMETIYINTDEYFIDYKCMEDIFDLGSKNRWFNLFAD